MYVFLYIFWRLFSLLKIEFFSGGGGGDEKKLSSLMNTQKNF